MIDDFRPTEPFEVKQNLNNQRSPQPIATTLPNRPLFGRTEPVPDFEVSFDDSEADDATKTTKKVRRSPKAWFLALSKRQKIAVIAGIVVLVAGIAAGVVLAQPSKSSPVVSSSQKKAPVAAPVPTTVASLLTGLQVDPSVNKRPVTGVMIENSTDARPQSGLDQAGVVFEAIAEGGITRFLALYQDTQPDYVGPVRSVRPYYLQWCQSFDCSIAHVGGSPEALQNIKDWGIKDLDQFYGASYFKRVNNRAAPHNMYTSLSQLEAYGASRGYTNSYTGLVRAANDKQATVSNVVATSVDLNFSGAAYNTHYDYDAASKTYRRSEGGAPHNVVDASGTTKQIAPKIVIAMVTPYSLASDHKHSIYGVVGSGEATIFQNGVAISGTWTKSDATSQLSFLDSAGTTIQLAPGQTWIAAVSTSGSVSFH